MKFLPCWLFIFCSLASADNASQVAEILAQIEPRKAAPIPFTEKRHSELLKEPLLLAGEISFSEEGVLTKQVRQPVVESVVISPDSLELRRKGKTRRLSMNRRADMRAFYAGMRALFNADAETLFELFDASSTVSGDDWTIDLAPKTAKLGKWLERLSVSGRGAQVLTVLTVQPGGDWQEMSFTAAAD